MASEPCDACGDDVPIGGGISGFWSSNPESTGGMTLAFDDGSEYFLCFECLSTLPEEPDEDDVRELVSA
jgi:hypothetical protein